MVSSSREDLCTSDSYGLDSPTHLPTAPNNPPPPLSSRLATCLPSRPDIGTKGRMALTPPPPPPLSELATCPIPRLPRLPRPNARVEGRRIEIKENHFYQM
ncbi:hypothetical protein ACJRO7_016626 [Eucalyptus globulus]|uniref:Uncharacterized protein n=1 Tax=Eucalyptus globulus TaxID=34317 RepID=A0ABD3L7N5_EUCGL